jgi:hypothetical protein
VCSSDLEISLIGRICEIPEHLFFRRDHPDAYSRRFYEKGLGSGAKAANSYQKRGAWWKETSQFSIASLKNCVEYFGSVRRVPLKWQERLLCYTEINRWFLRDGWMLVGNDFENAFLNRSRFGRKLASGAKLILGNVVIPIFKRMSG